MFLFFWQDWQEFVYGMVLVLMGIMSERLRQWWKNRDRNPFKWVCVDCIERGDGHQFYCSSTEPDVIDAIILSHKQSVHNGP